jgi:hypothetical protein
MREVFEELKTKLKVQGGKRMKRLIVLVCLLLLIVPAFLFSQDLGPWKAAYGDWRMMGGRLVQMSTKAGMAQAYMPIKQSGVVQYEFDVRYVDGAMDGYAGFGVHVGIDRPHPRKSWGNGKSFLLWLTYDPKNYGGSGVFAQAYKSVNASTMSLIHPAKAYMVPSSRLQGIYLNRLSQYVLPVKIRVNYDTGWVKVWDPIIPNYFYRFWLGESVRNGAYISVRTNSLAVSFGNFRVSKPASF